MAEESTKRPGRPRTRIASLVPFTARFTAQARARLSALAQVRRVPMYELLEQALSAHWAELPDADREAAETIAATLEQSSR